MAHYHYNLNLSDIVWSAGSVSQQCFSDRWVQCWDIAGQNLPENVTKTEVWDWILATRSTDNWFTVCYSLFCFAFCKQHFLTWFPSPFLFLSSHSTSPFLHRQFPSRSPRGSQVLWIDLRLSLVRSQSSCEFRLCSRVSWVPVLARALTPPLCASVSFSVKWL